MTKASVRKSQITRVVKAVQAAGVAVGRVEVAPDGTVKIFSEVDGFDYEADDLETRIQRMAYNGQK